MPNAKRIISFRSILIRGYAIVQDQIVWDVLQRQLPPLRLLLRELLEDLGDVVYPENAFVRRLSAQPRTCDTPHRP